MRYFKYLVFVFTLLTILFRANSVNALETIFTPTQVPATDPEISSPLRGLYDWRGTILVPPPTPSLDAYERYYWNELETTAGNYDWSMLDADIANARSKNKFFAFRIRTLKGPNDAGSFVPSDLSNTSYGWYKGSTFILDLNNSVVLTRMQTFFKALESHLNQTGMGKYISWVDIGMVGQYGEWGLGSLGYTSANYPTDDNLKKVVDIQLGFLPQVRKVMMVKTNSPAVLHALNSSPLVGWRVDCLGQDGYFDFSTNGKYTPFWPVLQNRWKTAPVIVEYCAGSISFSVATTQIADFHISAIGNGNVTFGGSNTSTLFVNNAKKAGYRISIIDAVLPQPMVAGKTSTIISRWQNTGNAPTYEPWTVAFELRDSSGKVVASTTTSLDLGTLLPTTSPQSNNDSFNLVGVEAGSYNLILTVKDPRALRSPLPLAITGRRTDGSYLLGAVTVSPSEAVIPSPITKIGDANADMFVNEQDYLAHWLLNYRKTLLGASYGDFNNDSVVSGIDYILWINNYGQ